MARFKTFFIPIILLVLILGYLSFYTVIEGQRALLLRLGKLVISSQTGQPVVIQPGLHVRLPILYQVRRFDVRLQTMDVQSSRVLTKEQKYVLVDYFVKWRIEDLPVYYTRTGGFTVRAETLLQQKVNDALRAAFGRRTITDVVSGERGNIMSLLKQKADESAQGLGITVVDVRIKRIDLPKEVTASVFARMSTKREQVATQHRAAGKAAAEKIRATADAQATVIIATAKKDAARVRAEGTSAAAKIYADVYNQDPGFYALYRSLEAYRNSFDSKHDILLIRPDNQFFKYFNDAKGAAKNKKTKA